MTMQTCKFTIVTAVDGEENTLIKQGDIDISEDAVVLRYDEENARVCITLQKGKAHVVRQGDYSLSLPLEQGKNTEGVLSLGGSDGKIALQTYTVKYIRMGSVFKLSLRYDLIFSEEERQKMQLNVRATIKE